MRIEQVNRYYCTAKSTALAEETNENTMADEDGFIDCDHSHRNYDLISESTAPGTKLPSDVKGLETLCRRSQSRLGVTRTPFLEPLGQNRKELSC